LNSNREHPYIVETQLAVIASKNIELAFYNISGVSAPRPWLKLTCCYFLPVVAFDIEDMDVIHPVHAVISAKVYYLWVNKASSCRNTRAWVVSANLRLDPGKGFGVQIKDVVQLAQLIRLATKNVNLFVESNRGVLESTNRCYSLSWHWPTPFESIKVKNQQVIQPELAIATTKYEHLVIDNAWGMELSHWRLSSDNARNIEAKLLNSFLEVNKNDVTQNLKTVPSTIYDYLTSVPNLTGMTHSRLRQFMLVNFRLWPSLLFWESK
jgi:hypothetical protein